MASLSVIEATRPAVYSCVAPLPPYCKCEMLFVTSWCLVCVLFISCDARLAGVLSIATFEDGLMSLGVQLMKVIN